MKAWITRDRGRGVEGGYRCCVFAGRHPPVLDPHGFWQQRVASIVDYVPYRRWNKMSGLRLRVGEIRECEILPTATGFEVKAK